MTLGKAVSNNKEYGCHLLAQPKGSNVHATSLFHELNLTLPYPTLEKLDLCLGITKTKQPPRLNDPQAQAFGLILNLTLPYPGKSYLCLGMTIIKNQQPPRLNDPRAQEYGCHLLAQHSGPVLNLTLPYQEKSYPCLGMTLIKNQQPPRLNYPRAQEYGRHLLAQPAQHSGPVLNLTLPYLEKPLRLNGLNLTLPYQYIPSDRLGGCNNLTHGKAVLNNKEYGCHLLAQPNRSNVHATSLKYLFKTYLIKTKRTKITILRKVLLDLPGNINRKYNRVKHQLPLERFTTPAKRTPAFQLDMNLQKKMPLMYIHGKYLAPELNRNDPKETSTTLRTNSNLPKCGKRNPKYLTKYYRGNLYLGTLRHTLNLTLPYLKLVYAIYVIYLPRQLGKTQLLGLIRHERTDLEVFPIEPNLTLPYPNLGNLYSFIKEITLATLNTKYGG